MDQRGMTDRGNPSRYQPIGYVASQYKGGRRAGEHPIPKSFMQYPYQKSFQNSFQQTFQPSSNAASPKSSYGTYR